MFRLLSNKLVAVLFALLLLLSACFMAFALFGAPMFLQELHQKVNLDLAENIVKEKELITDSKINEDALYSIFSGLMLVNPMIEVYLVDPEGKLLAYSAPEGVVKRESIDMAPVHTFLASDGNLPILGDDPRDSDGRKVFSAARVFDGDRLSCYLYVVLGGQAYDSVVEMMESSYMIRLWAATIGAGLLITAFAGYLIFRHITRRMEQLSVGIEQFKESDFQQAITLPPGFENRPRDEIDQLGIRFREMSERIMQQVKLLQHNDAARRELIANVSHDLRTPLASLQGYLETLDLKSGDLSEEDKKRYIHTAYHHCVSLRKLISELFELSTLDTQGTQLHFEPFSMSELAQDVCQKFQLEAERKGLKLSTEIPQQPAFVSADIGLIQRVLENLIENAIKYTPEGGTVTVDLLLGDDTVTTHISDTGLGIPDEDLPHVFERFYRVDKHRNTEGTGLGLAIAKRIMTLHGGSIDVRSRLNQGTTFTFSLSSMPA